MNKDRYQSQARGSIKPISRSGTVRVLVDQRAPKTPEVVKEYLSKKYSNITPVFAPFVPVPSMCHINKKTKVTNKVDIKPKIEFKTNKLNKSLARTANKTILLSMAVEAENNKSKNKNWIKSLAVRRLAVSILLFFILSTTGYVSFSTWQTNTEAKQVLVTLEEPAKTVDPVIATDTTKHQLPEGVSTDKSIDPLSTYTVAPDLPRAIYINKAKVAAPIYSMGLNSDNSLQVPSNAYQAGWYSTSSKPGQDGAMLIDGHSSGTGTHLGLFSYLVDVKIGDEIIIERGDGVKFTYTVRNTSTEPVDGLDMKKTLIPYDGAKQGVNLITCTGNWKADNSTLDMRLIVYATL